MTDVSAPPAPSTRWLAAAAQLLVFSSTLCLSAALLFTVQPLFTKMVLPRLGGAPAVWSVAMVFFQAALLGGYAYAYCLTRFLRTEVAAALHVLLLLAALLTLPIAVASGFDRPPQDGTALWLIALFALSVGAPFVAVSGNGPLLQAWFGRTGHAHAHDPYFLYGASTLGSFGGLVAYPIVVEPWLRAGEQAELWRDAYLVLVALVAACGLIASRASRGAPQGEEARAQPIAARRILTWIALAFVPSALLVGVTAHISTDVATAPLLWVVPLALFLLTFILVFRETPLVPARWLGVGMAASAAGLSLLLAYAHNANFALSLAGHLAGFFVLALGCHTALYDRRPSKAHLTAFYMWMSLGGVLGGIFAALVAPALFDTVQEYPLMIVAALLAHPNWRPVSAAQWRRYGGIVLLIAAPSLLPALFGIPFVGGNANLYLLFFTFLAGLILLWRVKPPLMLMTAALAMLLLDLYPLQPGSILFARSFFGVHKVITTTDGQFRLLMHGNTLHGAESLTTSDVKDAPLTYYYDGGPFSEAIRAARAVAGGRLSRVAVIGMGVGVLACHLEDGERLTFLEIDPEVIRLATDPKLFRSMATCGRDAAIIMGDARLTLADQPAGFDLIVVDAFSSDAVPAHLLTREAMALYKSRLGPNGVIALNTSNRNLELASVAAAAAEANGLEALTRRDRAVLPPGSYLTNAELVFVSSPGMAPAALTERLGWSRLSPPLDGRLWSDDYTNLVGAAIRNWRE